MGQELGIQQRKPVNYSPQKDVFLSGPLPTSAGESGLPPWPDGILVVGYTTQHRKVFVDLPDPKDPRGHAPGLPLMVSTIIGVLVPKTQIGP